MLGFLLVGCDEPQQGTFRPELEEPLYKEAQSLRETNPVGAREKFLQVISKRGSDQAPESHLELGLIYLDRKQPLDAIYHFNQFVRLQPTAAQVGQVRDLINTAHKVFLQNLPGQPYSGNVDRDELLQKLRAENDALKVRVTDLQTRLSGLESGRSAFAASQVNVPAQQASQIDPRALAPAQEPPPPPPVVARQIPETHTVQQGDTLFGISMKYYNTHTRWDDIYQANRGKMRSSKDLQIGMVLKLPQ